MNGPQRRIRVVCAVFHYSGDILACQRPPGGSMAGLWEFPGGKVEPGESDREALIREIREELNREIIPGEPLPAVEHQYADFHITLCPFLVESGSRFLPEKGEHADFLWVSPEDWNTLAWPEADQPILEYLTRNRRRLL